MRPIALSVAALTLLFSVSASAQTDTEKSLSAALFSEGRKLMEAGEFAKACPKFAESLRLVSAGGTALNLADCYAKQGKTASAWSAFREARALAKRDGRDDRIELAQKRIDELEPQLIYLTVNVEQPIGGMRVELDGVEVPSAGWGTATPVDPGAHATKATADGYEPFETTVDLQEPGTKETVTIPPLTQLDTPSMGPAIPPPETEGPSTEPPPQPDDTGGNTQATLGWVAVGLGGAGLVVGGIFGGLTLSAKSDSDAICDTPQCSPDQAEAIDLNEDAQSFATISNIGFIAGAALAATGVVLILTAPDDDAITTGASLAVSAGPGSLSLTGQF